MLSFAGALFFAIHIEIKSKDWKKREKVREKKEKVKGKERELKLPNMKHECSANGERLWFLFPDRESVCMVWEANKLRNETSTNPHKN